MEQAKERSNEMETAETLLKIMSSREDFGRSGLSSSNTKKDSVETQQQPQFKSPPTPAVNLGLSARKSAVPNPLRPSGIVPDRKEGNECSNMTRMMSLNEAAKDGSSPRLLPTNAYLTPPSPNFLIGSPYTFLQTMLAQQQQQASIAPTAVAASGMTPNPALLLQQRPILPNRSAPTKEHADIRREEVEKALHSKPQRGRKRQNLNEEERQELTRTRNREHAKSTRERKKQRHQELLEKERRYQALKSQQELQDQRRQTVWKFLQIRQAMLQQAMMESSAAAAELDSVILSRSDFRYHIRGQRGGAQIDGVTLMDLFDKSIATLLAVPDMQGVSYRYDTAAIGLTECGDAILECSIWLASLCIKILHLKISFAQGTSKILTVNVSFIQEESDRPPSLGNQVSHPSVVSLDDRLIVRTKTAEEEDTS